MYYFIVRDINSTSKKVFQIDNTDLFSSCGVFRKAYLPYIDLNSRPESLYEFFETIDKELIIIDVDNIIKL